MNVGYFSRSCFEEGFESGLSSMLLVPFADHALSFGWASYKTK